MEQLGEFELIARLTKQLPESPRVRVGVGDDAAVLACEAGQEMVATCDALVEGIHFVRAWATAEQVGRQALAVNLSDIAAMGGEPVAALVSLAIPQGTILDWLDGLYVGLRREAEAFRVALVGGNITSTAGPLIVDVTLLGMVAAGRAVLRSGARPGDRLCITGALGTAAAGLLSLRFPPGPAQVREPLAFERVRAALLAPQPRVAGGRALAETGGVTSMIDVSDGLAADLGHLCERSGVGATLDAAALPVLSATREVAQVLGRDAIELALHGGGDYELLFSVQPEVERAALEAARQTGVEATAIGWVTDQSAGVRLRSPDGTLAPLDTRGWDHLRRPGGPFDGGQ